MALFCIGLALLIEALILLAVTTVQSDEPQEAQEPIIMTAQYTPAPEPTPQTFVRWPVPLDDELQAYIVRECRAKEIDPSIVFAMIGVESQYRADAIGDHGQSFGLMQIWKSWHEGRMARLGVTDLLDPYQNVRVGIDILAELLEQENGMDWALSYYSGNGGAECEYSLTVQRNAECLLEGTMVVQK